MLERSAASMAAANTSLNKTIALGTAGNTILNDAEKVGTGLSTMSMRVRGSTVELEEAGEEIDDFAKSTSKMQATVKALSGVDIMSSPTEYKDIFDILQEISKVYESMYDVDRAALTETLFGKRQSNLGTAILSNFSIAESVMETLGNAQGSAMKEYDTYLNSIEGKQTRMQAAFQSMSSSLLSSEFIGGAYEGTTALLTALDGVVGKLQSIPTLITVAGTALTGFGKTGAFALQNQSGKNALTMAGSSFADIKQYGLGAFGSVDVEAINRYNAALEEGWGAEDALITARTKQNGVVKTLNKNTTNLIKAANGAAVGQQNLAAANTSVGVSAKLASIGIGIMNLAFNTLVSLGIGLAINAIVGAISALVTAAADAKEATRSFTNEWGDNAKTLAETKKTVTAIADEFERLEKGVSSDGSNLSLNTADYARYQELSAQIAEMFPNLISGWNDEGAAIVSVTDKVNGLIGAYETLSQKNRFQLLADAPGMVKGNRLNTKETQEKIDAVQYLTEAMDAIPDEVVSTFAPGQNSVFYANEGARKYQSDQKYAEGLFMASLLESSIGLDPVKRGVLTDSGLKDPSRTDGSYGLDYLYANRAILEGYKQDLLAQQRDNANDWLPLIQSITQESFETGGVLANKEASVKNAVSAIFNNLPLDFFSSSSIFSGGEREATNALVTYLRDQMTALGSPEGMSALNSIIKSGDDYANDKTTVSAYLQTFEDASAKMGSAVSPDVLKAFEAMYAPKSTLVDELEAVRTRAMSSVATDERKREMSAWVDTLTKNELAYAGTMKAEDFAPIRTKDDFSAKFDASMEKQTADASALIAKWEVINSAQKVAAEVMTAAGEGGQITLENYNKLLAANPDYGATVAIQDGQARLNQQALKDILKAENELQASELGADINEKAIALERENAAISKLQTTINRIPSAGKDYVQQLQTELDGHQKNADALQTAMAREGAMVTELEAKKQEAAIAELAWASSLDKAQSAYLDTLSATTLAGMSQLQFTQQYIGYLDSQGKSVEALALKWNTLSAAHQAANEVMAAVQESGYLGTEDYAKLMGANPQYGKAITTGINGLTLDTKVLQEQIDAENALLRSDLVKAIDAKRKAYDLEVSAMEQAEKQLAKMSATEDEAAKAKKEEIAQRKANASAIAEEANQMMATVTQLDAAADGYAAWQAAAASANAGDNLRGSKGVVDAVRGALKTKRTNTDDYRAATEYLFGFGSEDWDAKTISKETKRVSKYTDRDGNASKALIRDLVKGGYLSKGEDGSYSVGTKSDGKAYTRDEIAAGMGLGTSYIGDAFKNLSELGTFDFSGLLNADGTLDTLEAAAADTAEALKAIDVQNVTAGVVNISTSSLNDGTQTPPSGEAPPSAVAPGKDSDVDGSLKPTTLEAELDTGRAAEAISSLTDTAVVLETNLDTSGAQQDVSNLADTPVELKASLDSNSAEQVVSSLTFTDLEVGVGANTSGITEAVSSLTFTDPVVSIGADTSGAIAANATLEAALGRSVTKTVVIKPTFAGPQFAKGTRNAPRGAALVGEEAPEIVTSKKDGTWFLAKEPQFVNLEQGDAVFNGSETKRMLRAGGVPTAGGNAYASGTVGTNVFRVLRDYEKAQVSSTKTSTGSQSRASSSRVTSSAPAAPVVVPVPAIPVIYSSAEANSQYKASGSADVKDLYNWITKALEVAKNATSDLIRAVSDKIGHISKNNQLEKAIQSTAKEIETNQNAYNRYMVQADYTASKMGLSAVDVSKIQNGSIDIGQYSSSMQEKISAYKQWWDLAEGTLDTIKDLKDQEKELALQKLDNITNYYTNKISRFEAQVALNDALREKKIATGVEIKGADFASAIDATRSKISALTAQRDTLNKQIQSLITAGILVYDSDEWHKYTGELEALDEEVVRATVDLEGLKDSVAEIKLTNLQASLKVLQQSQTVIEKLNALRDAQGTDKQVEDYAALIKNSAQQIANFEEQNRELMAQQNGLDAMSEKYQEIQDKIDANTNSIMSAKIAQEEWNDASLDLKIDALQKQRDEMEKVNSAYKRQRDLQEAVEALDRANSQRSQAVFVQGQGFQYRAKEADIRAAQNALDDLRHEETLNKFDEMIEAIRESKKTDNVYDASGENVIKAYANGGVNTTTGIVRMDGTSTRPEVVFNATDAAKLYNLVHNASNLGEMLRNEAVKAFQNGGAVNYAGSASGSLSIQFGDINLNGVQETDGLADAIVRDLPSKLMQRLYYK